MSYVVDLQWAKADAEAKAAWTLPVPVLDESPPPQRHGVGGGGGIRSSTWV